MRPKREEAEKFERELGQVLPQWDVPELRKDRPFLETVGHVHSNTLKKQTFRRWGPGDHVAFDPYGFIFDGFILHATHR